MDSCFFDKRRPLKGSTFFSQGIRGDDHRVHIVAWPLIGLQIKIMAGYRQFRQTDIRQRFMLPKLSFKRMHGTQPRRHGGKTNRERTAECICIVDFDMPQQQILFRSIHPSLTSCFRTSSIVDAKACISASESEISFSFLSWQNLL